MATSILRADLGRTTAIDATAILAGIRLATVSRLARAQLATPAFSIWCQLRGTTTIDAREGRFRLGPGDWIALDPESLPTLQASRETATSLVPARSASASMVAVRPRSARTVEFVMVFPLDVACASRQRAPVACCGGRGWDRDVVRRPAQARASSIIRCRRRDGSRLRSRRWRA